MSQSPIIDPPYSWPYGAEIAVDPSFQPRVMEFGAPLLPTDYSAYGSRVSIIEAPPSTRDILDQENRIRVAIDDLVEFLNVMGAD